jgi:DNA-binding CsgD family transcriptional regulator
VSVQPAVTWTQASPLREFLRARVERILTGWESADVPPLGHPARRAMQRFLDALDELSGAADALVSPPAGGNGETAGPLGSRVLLVGSDPSHGSRLRDELGVHYRAEIASARDALWSAAAQRPDLVVGYDAAAIDAIRALHDICPGLPAVLVVPAPVVSDAVRTFTGQPVVLLRDPVSPEEVVLTIRGLLALAQQRRSQAGDGAGATLDSPGEPRSFAHLAGLLPRALERSIRFDVSATVVKRAEADPIVEVYAATEVSEETLRAIRELALSLSAGAERPKAEAAAAANDDSAVQSILHARLAIGGRILGAVVLAAFRPDAFSANDERILASLAGRAAAAYLRLEASLTKLRLTPRQSQVLALIASGHSDKEIASRLGVSHRTVRTHLDRLLREHGLHSRTEAVAAWLRSQQG